MIELVDFIFPSVLISWQIAFPDAVYLVDAVQGGEELVKVCKPALESKYVTKVIHDCKRDSEVSFGLCFHHEMPSQRHDMF